MNKITLSAVVLVLMPAMTLAAAGVQEVLSPAQYFECQVSMRRATIVGLQERVAQMNRTDITDAQKRASGDVARERVTLAMYACGKQNASMLGAYAYRNAEELQTWLNANPKMKARLDALSQQVAGISSQMPVVSPSAKR